MPGKLQREIQQNRPFSGPEEEAFLNIQRTADSLQRALSEVLKPHGLSATQYNVLRILRGAGERGTHCKDVGERMVTAEPDVTRLLDRLEKRGLVTRSRTNPDRRFVSVRISGQGLELLEGLDQPVIDVTVRCLGHLGRERLGQLIELLEAVREKDA